MTGHCMLQCPIVVTTVLCFRVYQAYVVDGQVRHSDATAKAAAEALMDEALRRGTLDNVTVIVMLLQWS